MAELLAKPDTLLIAPLAGVTRMGNEIAQRLGLSERLRVKVLLACALRDIVKATGRFSGAHARQVQDCLPPCLSLFPLRVRSGKSLGFFLWQGTKNLGATASVLTHHSPLGPRLYRGYEKPPDFLP